jgi:hypothetical protein
MTRLENLKALLRPVVEVVRAIDPSSPDARGRLEAALPLDSAAMRQIRALVREGVESGWLCDRENGGIRFSRVEKDVAGISIDAVHMGSSGAPHLHPNGEIDLCFAVSGSPRFDGHDQGWTVYPPNSWHVPTVEGGQMDILYFLPGGAIRFGAKPENATAVGLQAA